MARRRITTSVPPPPDDPQLTESVESSRTKLQTRIKEGEAIRQRRITDVGVFQQLKADQQTWSDYNEQLLRRLFTTNELRDQYSRRTPAPTMYTSTPPWDLLARRELEKLEMRLGTLRSIVERLELYEPAPSVGESESAETAARQQDMQRAFIVHGHDDAARDAVARVLEGLGIEPVILFEKPSGGRTVIEKLEAYSDVGFAVVLLTPDDEGGVHGSGDMKPRARQNVVFELGYFIGKLTRLHVCALHKGGLELPSDYHGVVYVQMDDAGAWKYKLADEMGLAGYTIDKNRIS